MRVHSVQKTFVVLSFSVCISRFIVDCQTGISLIQDLTSHNLK